MAAVDELEARAGAGRPVARRRPALLRRRRCSDTIPDQVADVGAVLRDWRPAAIACDLSMWGPMLSWPRRCRVPVALSSTFMGPLTPGPDAPPAGLGLPPPAGPRAPRRGLGRRPRDRRRRAPLRDRVDAIRARPRARAAGPLGQRAARAACR